MPTINEKFQERLNDLVKNKEIGLPDINASTFSKYLSGTRFPSTSNLEIIKEHYHVSYSYLFGEVDNDDIETTKESIALGLDKDVINKLVNIQKTNNKISRENKKFAINSFLREMDFNILGERLSLPSYYNPYIASEDYYSLYTKRFRTDIVSQLINCISESNELFNYKIYKQITNLCEKTRKSQKCIDMFKLNLNYEEELRDEQMNSAEDSYYNDKFDDNINDIDLIDITGDITELIKKRKGKVGK